jgi:branched-chain amino acid transport system substrate-binding protein
LKKELHIQELKAVIIADKGSSGDSIVNFWEKSLPGLGIEVVATYRPNASASDLTTEINGIKESGAQIVMQMLTGAAGSAFAGKWGELQIPAVSLGVNFSAQSKTIIEATASRMNYLASGALISNAAITAKTIPFFNRFSEKYKDYPAYGGPSYDAVWIYKEAVEKAGSLDPDKVVSMLEKTDFTGVTNRIMFGDMNTPFPHDMLSSQTKGYAILPLVQWINGEQVSVWPPDLKGSQKYRNPPWIGISK